MYFCYWQVVEEEEYDVWLPRSVGKTPCVILLYTFLMFGHWKNKTSSQTHRKEKQLDFHCCMKTALIYSYTLFDFAISQFRVFSLFYKFKNLTSVINHPTGATLGKLLAIAFNYQPLQSWCLYPYSIQPHVGKYIYARLENLWVGRTRFTYNIDIFKTFDDLKSYKQCEFLFFVN